MRYLGGITGPAIACVVFSTVFVHYALETFEATKRNRAGGSTGQHFPLERGIGLLILGTGAILAGKLTVDEIRNRRLKVVSTARCNAVVQSDRPVIVATIRGPSEAILRATMRLSGTNPPEIAESQILLQTFTDDSLLEEEFTDLAALEKGWEVNLSVTQQDASRGVRIAVSLLHRGHPSVPVDIAIDVRSASQGWTIETAADTAGDEAT